MSRYLPDRLQCVVDGCCRSIGADTARKRWGYVPAAFLCPSHWRRATQRERATLFRIRREMRRVEAYTGHVPEALRYRDWRVWCAIARRVANRPPVEPTR